MVSFENFVKSMPPSLSELNVIPSFCFSFKIPDDPTATTSHSFAMAKYFFQSERFEFSIFCKSKMENVPFIDFTDNRTASLTVHPVDFQFSEDCF